MSGKRSKGHSDDEGAATMRPLRPAIYRDGDGSSAPVYEARRRYLELVVKTFPESLAERQGMVDRGVVIMSDGTTALPWLCGYSCPEALDNWAQKWGLCAEVEEDAGGEQPPRRVLRCADWVEGALVQPHALFPLSQPGTWGKRAMAEQPAELQPPLYLYKPLSQDRATVRTVILEHFRRWLESAMDEAEAAIEAHPVPTFEWFDIHAEWAVRYQHGATLHSIAHSSRGKVSVQAVRRAVHRILELVGLTPRSAYKSTRCV